MRLLHWKSKISQNSSDKIQNAQIASRAKSKHCASCNHCASTKRQLWSGSAQKTSSSTSFEYENQLCFDDVRDLVSLDSKVRHSFNELPDKVSCLIADLSISREALRHALKERDLCAFELSEKREGDESSRIVSDIIRSMQNYSELLKLSSRICGIHRNKHQMFSSQNERSCTSFCSHQNRSDQRGRLASYATMSKRRNKLHLQSTEAGSRNRTISMLDTQKACQTKSRHALSCCYHSVHGLNCAACTCCHSCKTTELKSRRQLKPPVPKHDECRWRSSAKQRSRKHGIHWTVSTRAKSRNTIFSGPFNEV